MHQQRIQFLDGLRGVAVLSVFVFHAYVAYPDTLPFGSRFEVLPIRLGWQGVELFFLISGFVILMTLERCCSIQQFAHRRWARLFPAMITVSLLIFALERHSAKDLIPGLTFISPSLINAVTGIKTESLSGVFWSLYVEVAFYAVFGALYFWTGARTAIVGIFTLFVLSAITTFAADGLAKSTLMWRMAAASQWLGFIHFGWFTSGALFYLYTKNSSKFILAVAVATGAISALTTGRPPVEAAGFIVVLLIFLAALFSPLAQRALSLRPLVFLGAVSYPFYLVHYFVVKQMLWPTAATLSFASPALWPIPALIISIGVAWLIHVYIEKPLGGLINAIRINRIDRVEIHEMTGEERLNHRGDRAW
jgi:peptidoglycan/LPS O-acetylase OafA/YrhL